MQQLYSDISFRTSKLVTRSYSTSFSHAISFLDAETRQGIYSIYGFVRLADEIVDTFHDYNREKLFAIFERDYKETFENRISLNPVLNSFYETVIKFNISPDLMNAFIRSMKADLKKSEYNSRDETDEYIYGSAEVVGLMCLKVFVKGDENLFTVLSEPARRLGAAFQKVNFLRDLRNDIEGLQRYYFHHTLGRSYDENVKKQITDEIEEDFMSALPGIKKLPGNSKIAVLIAYYYFHALLRKISRTPAAKQFHERIRIPDPVKLLIMGKALIISKLRLI